MRKILIIDDEPIVCNYIAEVLRTDYDTEVIISHTYTNIDKLLETGHDAVVLDVMMPFDKEFFADMAISDTFPEFSTGKYLFKKIRQRYPKLPVFFYTAYMGEIECDGHAMVINKPNLAVKVAKTISDFITRCKDLN